MSSSASTLTRKQRQIAERHQLFLSIARQVMHRDGFHQLTMEQIAEQAEYSKGTLYQHFPCKEEILIQLCLKAMTGLHQLGVRAGEYPGSQREKLLAFVIAHELWQQMEPSDVFMLQNLHGDGVLDKVAKSSRDAHHKLEGAIIQIVAGFFEQAIVEKQLPKGNLHAKELVYGLWSMCHGAQLLRCYQKPLVNLNIGNPVNTIVSLIQVLLDGLNWQPGSTPAQTEDLIEHCSTEFFAVQIEAIKHSHTLHTQSESYP